MRACEVCGTEAGDGLADVLFRRDENGEDDEKTNGVPARDAIVEVIVAGTVVPVMAHFSGSIEEERSRAERTTMIRDDINISMYFSSLPQFAFEFDSNVDTRRRLWTSISIRIKRKSETITHSSNQLAREWNKSFVCSLSV